MKNRMVLLPAAALVLAALACNFEQQAVPTLSEQQIQTLSAQTLMAIQWQTLSAGGNTPGGGPGATVEIPADTATNTLMPTVTPTGTTAPTSTFTPTMTNTPVPCNWAQFISDVTVPDNWETGPLDHFTKTWRLRNIGSCTWTSGYSLVFDHGDQMSAPASQQLTPGTVAPGASIDVSVNLLTPATVGTYQGFFKLRASDSSIFGIGADANTAFWVKVKVVTPAVMTSQVEAQVTVAPGTSGNATADCPAGSIVVGGGFDGDDGLTPNNYGKIGNGWRAYAKNYTALNKVLRAYAFCLTGVSGSSAQVSHDENQAAGAYSGSAASCPGGSVISGLGYATDSAAQWVYRSDMAGGNARTYAKNFSGVVKILRTYVICLTAAGATTVQATNSTIVAAHSTATVEAACPAGTVVTGAGFALGETLNLVALYKKSGAEAVAAKALNLGGTALELNAYAVCLAIS
ncbi:MAG: NBR1-Ig-like domain-containing protein [Anaerolineales bacterium]